MTQEEKHLLLADLCSRLPYGVFVQDRNGKHILTPGNTEFVDLLGGKCNIKPYLRPMSSMSEEEESKYNLIQGLQHWTVEDGMIQNYGDAIDWLNSHYFDYRGLIEKGFALEAPEDMYKV